MLRGFPRSKNSWLPPSYFPLEKLGNVLRDCRHTQFYTPLKNYPAIVSQKQHLIDSTPQLPNILFGFGCCWLLTLSGHHFCADVVTTSAILYNRWWCWKLSTIGALRVDWGFLSRQNKWWRISFFLVFFRGEAFQTVAPPCFFHGDFGVQTGEIAPFQQRRDPIWGFSHIWKAETWGEKNKQTHWIRKCSFLKKKLQKFMSTQLCNFFSEKKTLRSQLGWLSRQRFFAVAAALLGVRANDWGHKVRPFFDEGFF